jgi:molybdate transport system substrate-binding protein
VQAPPGVPVGSLVADGKVELGFHSSPSWIHLSGIDVVGPLPPRSRSSRLLGRRHDDVRAARRSRDACVHAGGGRAKATPGMVPA